MGPVTVTRVVLLDAGPLGMAAKPPGSADAVAVSAWVQQLRAVGTRVIVPEIADYEVRRELVRAGKAAGVARLDGLAATLGYLRLTTADFRRAADLWAQARRGGRPTAADPALDADVILAAQALGAGPGAVVATTNPAHLSRFVAADLWPNIR